MYKPLFLLFYFILISHCHSLMAAEKSIHKSEEIKENLAQSNSYWEFDLGASLRFERHYIQGINNNANGDMSANLIVSGGYYYKDFFLEISPLVGRPLTVGYSLQRTKHFVVNIIAESLFEGFDQSSQQRGQQLNGINKRSTSLDGGIEVYYSHKYGESRFRALGDISQTHGGYILAFDYAYPIFRNRWTIWPAYGISWLSEDVTDYYFGIKANEATINRPIYKPHSSFTHKLNVYLSYQYTPKISFIAYGDYTLFSANINKSPLVMPNNDSYRFGLGVMWSF